MSVDCPFYKLPKASDSSFIEFLLDLCVELGINVIFPLVTRELFELSKHKQKFLEKGIKVIVSDKDALFLAVLKLLEDSKLRYEMGQRGRKLILQDFTQEKIAAETISVWNEFLK